MVPVKIKVRKITLNRGEGPTSECGPKPPVSTFAEANRQLSQMRWSAPKKGYGYDKTDFVLEFEDGEIYKGRIDLQQDVYEYLEDHVRKFCLMASGRATTRDLPHLTPERYKALQARYTDEDRAGWAKWLDNYQIGD